MTKQERIAAEALNNSGIFAGHRTHQWGVEVVESVEEYYENSYFGEYPEDNLFDIADANVPIYTQDLLTLAADSPDLATYEGELTYDAETVEDKLRGALYEIASQVAYAAYTKLADDYKEDDED